MDRKKKKALAVCQSNEWVNYVSIHLMATASGLRQRDDAEQVVSHAAGITVPYASRLFSRPSQINVQGIVMARK